jgi:hypothetical protein
MKTIHKGSCKGVPTRKTIMKIIHKSSCIDVKKTNEAKKQQEEFDFFESLFN